MTKKLTERLDSRSLWLALLIYLLLCLVTYICLSSINGKNEKFKLAILQNNVEQILKKEFELAILGEGRKFFISSNHHQEDKNPEESRSINITKQNTVIIVGSNSKITLDLQEIKEFIDEVLPSYVIYKILLNEQLISSNCLKAQQYLSVNSFTKIDNDISLSTHLSIKKNSNYYKENSKRFHRKYLNIISWFLLIIIFCYICVTYLSNKRKLINRNLQHEILSLQNREHLLSQYIKILQKFEHMLIDHKDLRQDGYEIDILELESDLKGYFNLDKINIEFQININFISLPCTKETFYQIIFSLINLLIMLTKGQSNQSKPMLISFNKQQVLVSFESFTLDEDKMIYLEDNVLQLKKSFFLLSCRNLFQSLKTNNIKYSFTITGEYDHILTLNLNKIIKPSANKVKILKFRPKKEN